MINQKGAAHILILVAIIGVVAFLAVSYAAPFKNNLLTSIFPKDWSFAATLPVPANVKVEPDDRTTIVKWDNNGTIWPLNAKPDGVNGYVLYWGVYNQSNNTITSPEAKLTENTVLQLQPLTDGVKYGAYIQSVDSLGNVSAPTAIVTFQSDPTRVNALRTQMNGFFDDFNRPAGAFDELRWNWALSSCAGSGGTGALDGQFINAQFHAHNQSFSQYCDRSQNVSRPRNVFDFTPGVARPSTGSQFSDSEYGTIAFDFDGAQGRDTWYLDLYDVANGIVDVPSRSADDPSVAQSPYNNIRIVQPSGGQLPQIKRVDERGFLADGLTTPGAQINCDMVCGTTTNVRNHWVIKVSKQRVIILINGKTAADVSGWRDSSGDHTSGLNLPFSKAYVLWVQFSYNTPKADMASSLIHWDNFGFNAPTGTVQTVETHNYIDGNIGMPVNNPCRTGNGPPGTLCRNGTATVKIPDSLSGATARRLMFVAAGEIGWQSTDYIRINGVKYPIPDPKTLALNIPLGTPQRVMDGTTPLQFVMPINSSDLVTGDNKIELVSNWFQMLDIHIEVDFPKGGAPSFTQPIDIWHFNPAPTITANGFSEIPNQIGMQYVHGIDKNGVGATWQVWNFSDYVLRAHGDGTEPAGSQDPCSWCNRTRIQMSPDEPIYQSGTMKFDFIGNGWTTLVGSGSISGHKAYQVWVDRQKVFEQRTDATVPAPSISGSYSLDTTKLCNGSHQVFFESYTPSGMPSQAGTFHSNITPGNYSPVTIYTNNPGQSACVINQIHAGTNNVIDESNGTNWEPVIFTGGTVFTQWQNYEPFYQVSSVGNQSYTFTNLPNGSYDVTFKFAETQGAAVGARKFNVSLNGTQVLTNFDIAASAVSGKIDKKFTTNVTNGTIPVQFSSVVGQPIITAIQAVPTGTTYTLPTFTLGGATPSPSATSAPSVQPSINPSVAPSASVAPTPSASVKPGDIDGNNKVDIFDYNLLLTDFGKTGTLASDLDKNGKVDIFDFNILLTNFGK